MSAPASRFVELGTGLRYHLLEWGDPRSSELSVLLLHGFLDLGWGWDRTCRAGLADRFHTIACDFRGHGDSDRIGAGGYYHFADYLADLDALLEQLPERPLALVGHSMGGTIASYFAGAFPDRICKLALLEGIGPPAGPIDQPERIRAWLSGWRRARTRAPRIYPDLDAAAARLRAHDRHLSAELARELAERGTRPVDGGVVFKHDGLHLSRGPYPFQVELAETLWRAIACPVLAVDAAESELTLPAAERDRRYGCIADLRREVIDGAGHMLQRHQPEALAALLVDFLAGA